MIEQATRKDIPQLLEITKKMHKEMELPLPWDSESSEIQLRNLLILSSANIFIEKDDNGDIIGAIGGPIMAWPFDLNIMVAQEYFCFGENMRASFYEWAKNMGAKAVIKLCVDPSDGNRTVMLGDS